MAMAETSNPSDRHSRRKPFTSWVKRLTNRKHSSPDPPSNRTPGKLSHKGKRQQNGAKNNPYPLSGNPGRLGSAHSYNDTVSYDESSTQNPEQASSQQSLRNSVSEHNIQGNSAKSTAPTLSTNGDTTRSETGYSKAGTMATGHGGTTGGGEGSTFSSPAPSVRSLTTTLTTVQSTAPSTQIYGAYNNQAHNGSSVPHVNSSQNNNANQQVHFSHQFPPSPASAVPPHLAPNGPPTTYSSATANSLLTDNASILTLASSSKRRRRNSLDTNASVRALAPSSVFGGSRESLPLSVLSANVGEASNTSVSNVPGVLGRQSLGGLASAERISVYSSSGAAPLIAGGDRGSLIASKQGDNGSIRSGMHSHTRNDSTTGSTTGVTPPTSAFPTSNNNNTTTSTATTTTTTPTGSTVMPGRISRRSSTWGEISGEGEEDTPPQTEQEGGPAEGDDHKMETTSASKETPSSEGKEKEKDLAEFV
ncbi:hypothetical protein PISL3812_02545 [Talaromyces islandicus]|uniref:Uncharacterized protein n=1 Tax=Talaromyces islandicus TaxID=28573 RepID=A0A0U1LRY0_TALIS|nr:hypothetical protein PISL3812_02545 [Talaromyces islandicus]